MTFLAGSRLVLLLAVAGLVVAYVVVQRRRPEYAVRFTNLDLLASVAPRRPGWRRHLPAAALALALGLLVTAFARPARSVKVPRERATVMMAIDVSLSMQATDVYPTRIDAAIQAASTFVDLLPPRLNLGLVTFAGTAQVMVSPTTDHELVKRSLQALELSERTAIGEAVLASLSAIETVPEEPGQPPAPGRVVLMSDGATTQGRPNEMAAVAAKEAGVPVSTIAFGTDSGVVWVEGAAIPVPVDRQALAELARSTGGRPFEAATESELERVYADIGSSVGFRSEKREISTWFVGFGLALALAAAAGSLVWTSRLP